LDQAAGENLAAYVRILRQLDALERMLARRADARPDEGSGEPPSALIEDKLQGTHAEPAKPEGSVQLEDISSRATTESTTMDDPPLTLPETSPHIPQAVTEGVVSREQMADSLFAAGKIRAAMDIYQELLQGNPAGDDAAWFHYQIASCLRRLGDPDTAARHLRIVAGQSDAEMLGEYAKWWLDSFQTKRSLRQALEDLQTVVDSAKGKP
jgi:tetratricopeptide (TPR) repeat protein